MRMKKRLAVLLAALFLLAAVPAVVQAEDTWVLDKLEKDDVDLDPIPLLIIKINYDADGDGKDAYIEGIDAKTVRENGEQWTHTTDSYWSEMCFSDTGKSLKNYYETVSNGSFYFYPAEETYADASAHPLPCKVTELYTQLSSISCFLARVISSMITALGSLPW